MAGTSELGSASQYDYKSQGDMTDMDDMKSQYTSSQSQAGVTVF
jgi:regulator of nonsense transcripts 1